MAWPDEPAARRQFEAPPDVVYDAALAAVSGGTLRVRLVSHNRVLGRIILKTIPTLRSVAEGLCLAIGGMGRGRTEVWIDLDGRPGPRAMPVRHRHLATEILDAIGDRVAPPPALPPPP